MTRQSKQSNSLEPGPQTGAPPSLEFIGLDRLRIDPAYQRAIHGPKSRRLIAGMVKRWDWALCLPLLVSRRADGSLWILDGQHRHTGARERGDIQHLPCVVQPSLDPALEARIFVGVNTRRQALSQTDLFIGMLAYGDEDARLTSQLLDETGWRVVRTTGTDRWKPGDLTCAPLITRLLKVNGAAAVRSALWILRQAWPDVVITSPASLIQAMVLLVREGGKLAGDPESAIVEQLRACSPAAWLASAARLREADPSCSRIVSLARAIGEHAFIAKTPRVSARLLAPPPRKVELPPAGDSSLDGKCWCDQCEQRVTAGQAQACKSQFCAAKAKAA